MEHNPMTFWSGEALESRLQSLIEPFSKGRVDCAAYTLSIGREVYVSPNDQTVDPGSVSIRQLGDGVAFTIPPGQFAFLLTDEIVRVPPDAIAWISMKARIKWRGLINVSGFHVDPGFHGRLVFAVFNAGPVPVHLRQGQAAFLIWYSGLDRASERIKNEPVQTSIPIDLITAISGELHSFAGLSKKIKETEKSLIDKVHSIEREQTYYRVVGVIALGVIVAMAVTWVREGGPSRIVGNHAGSASNFSLFPALPDQRQQSPPPVQSPSPAHRE